MKAFRPSRQATLKGLLLFALLLNISWEPLANHFSLDLASTTPAPNVTAAPAAPTTGRLDCSGKDKQQCVKESMSKAQRDEAARKSAATKAQIDAEAKKTGNKTTAAPDLKSNSTEAATTTAECADCAAKEKTANEQRIKELEKQIAEIKKTATANDDDEPTRAATRPAVEDIRACKVDEDGDDLSKLAEFECQSKRISSAKTSSEKREIARKIQDLYNSLRKEAKDDLFAKDAGRREDGERTISAMISALSRVSFDRDSERTKMVDSLEGLRAGAQSRATAMDLEEEVKDLESDVKSVYREANQLNKDFTNSCRTRTGCDRDLFEALQDKRAELNDLKEDHTELVRDIVDARDESSDDMDEYKDSMSRAELREFTSPYAKLMSRMQDMTDPRKLNSSTNDQTTAGQDPRFNGSGQAFLDQNGLPADFYSVRGGQGALNRSNGMYSFPNQQQPMGSQGNLNMQLGQGTYTPQYMVPGMGMQNSLLPMPPGGMQMGYGQPYGQMGAPMMNGQMNGRPNVIPANGGRPMPYGQQPYGYGQPMGGNVMPARRTY